MLPHPQDLRSVGARARSTRALLLLLLGKRVDDDVIDAAASALSLQARARDAALLRSPQGPRLVAALELGRRAWMSTPPMGTRVQGPVDVAAVAAPRLVDSARPALLCLDGRGRLAHFTKAGNDDQDSDSDDVNVLQQILMAGCRRGVLCWRLCGPAVPDAAHVERMLRLQRSARMVGVDVIDGVLLGDDGFCSLLRLGLIGAARHAWYL